MRKYTTTKQKIKFLIDTFKGYKDKDEIKKIDLKQAQITISQILDELEKGEKTP